MCEKTEYEHEPSNTYEVYLPRSVIAILKVKHAEIRESFTKSPYRRPFFFPNLLSCLRKGERKVLEAGKEGSG